MTKFYLHNTTSGLPSGTLPTAEQSTLTADDNFEADQTTNRLMDTTIGAGQTTLTNESISSTSIQNYYVARWVSPVVSVTTIDADTWTWNFASTGSSNHDNFPVSGADQPVHVNCYVWRPSTGAKVGTILDGNTANSYTEGGPNAEVSQHGIFSGAQVTGLTSGDACIVFEAWFRITQAMAASYTQTFYFDGATETTTSNTSVSDHASFIQTPQTLLSTQINKTLSETVGVSETIARLSDKVRARAETVTSSEAMDRLADKARTRSETVTSIDSVAREVSGGGPNNVERTASDTLSVNDSHSRIAGKWRKIG